METPPTPLIKSKHDDKLEKYFVNIQLRRYPTSEKSDLYEFKIAVSNNGDPEEFLLFIHYFNMTLKAPGMLETSAKVQYLCTLVRGEVLCQFETLYDDTESTTPLTVEVIILVLGLYYIPINFLSKKNHTMRLGMRNPRRLKVRRHAVRFIELKEYLDLFPGANLTEKLI